MGRQPVSNERRIATAVRLPESIHERLRRAAEERSVSANLLVTKALAEYLDRLPDLDEALEPRRARSRSAARP